LSFGPAVPRSIKSANPFYALLIVAGIAFAMTAMLFGVMTLRESRAAYATESAPAPAEHPLMTWMHHHGDRALMIELALLAVGTVGAIATDSYWQSRATRK
jgi:hypothetical protein